MKDCITSQSVSGEIGSSATAFRTSGDARFQKNNRLLRLAKSGDNDAASELIKLNGGLVSSIAVRFLGRGTDFEDLTEIGNIGLLKAIRTFDESRECAFSTYAVPLIFGEIRRFLRDDGLIKVSRTYKALGARLTAAREKALQEGAADIRLETLAALCGVSMEEATEALDAVSPITSLSEPISSDDDSPTYENMLCDEDENERSFNRIAIADAMKKLPETARKIILMRYFRDYSQEETAKALGLTQVKISREEKKILAFLKAELS